jgi:hypothetical protein
MRARAPRRGLHTLDARAGQDRVKRCGELLGAAADQEPEPGAVTGIDQEMTDLLGGPRPVRVRGDPGNVNVAAAGFDDEQAVQAPEGDGAVPVEDAGRAEEDDDAQRCEDCCHGTYVPSQTEESMEGAEPAAEPTITGD